MQTNSGDTWMAVETIAPNADGSALDLTFIWGQDAEPESDRQSSFRLASRLPVSVGTRVAFQLDRRGGSSRFLLLSVVDSAQEDAASSPSWGVEQPTMPDVAMCQKLDSIIIPSVSFNEARLSDVMDWLVQQSIVYDEEGTGINIVLAAPEVSASSGLITMDVDNMPLGQLIRFVCQVGGTTFHVAPYGVILADRETVLEEMAYFSAPIDSAFADGTTGADADAHFTNMFWELGMDFPGSAFVRYWEERRLLVFFNTAENYSRFKQVASHLKARTVNPAVVCGILEASSTESVPRLAELLHGEHRWLASQTIVVANGCESESRSSAGMSFTVTPRMVGWEAFSLALTWSWQSPEGKDLTAESIIHLPVGESQVIPIEQVEGRTRYVIVGAHAVDSAGDVWQAPRRSEDPVASPFSLNVFKDGWCGLLLRGDGACR